MEPLLGNLSEVENMDYAKLAEGIFSSLGAEEDSDAKSDISSDADTNNESSTLRSTMFGTSVQKVLSAISLGGIGAGLTGALWNKLAGASDESTTIWLFSGLGFASLFVLVGMGVMKGRSDKDVKKAEALVHATERYIKQQADTQAKEAEKAAEVEKAAEQTKSASSFFSTTRPSQLTVDFSNPMNLSGAMGNIGDFNVSSGRNTGVVPAGNHSAEKFKWL